MKENTKYHKYRFVGKINVDEIQPWFDFTSMKPWDEAEIPWMLDNRVRREILFILSHGALNFDNLHDRVNFSPSPLLVTKEEYSTNVSYQWPRKTIQNHLLNLEWYNLIQKKEDKYHLSFPVIKTDERKKVKSYIAKFANHWVKIIKDLKSDIKKDLSSIEDQTALYEILIENAVDKLYALLKVEGILPNKPNLKALWAEELREIDFEEWVQRNY
ncbi:MAG: hypothetical protein ACOC35_05080 [Promethearchaeia archaeon]